MKPACKNLHNKDMNKPCGFHGKGFRNMQILLCYYTKQQNLN